MHNRHLTRTLFAALLIVSASVAAAKESKYRIKPITKKQAEEYKLDQDFYKKGTMVQNILIATSDKVSDTAHREAAYLFDMIMKTIDQDVAQRMREKKVLCLLIGHDELTSDMPQFGSDKKGEELDFYNWRSRGFLCHKNGRPTVVFAEEDVLEYDGGMLIESILIHEFGHVIHGAGFDEALQKRLTETYEKAKAAGLWNDGRAAQRYRRIKSKTPVSLYDALVKSFPDQSPELIEKCLDSGDILVNGKPTNSKIKVTGDDKVLICFGGEKECYAGKNRAEYWAEGVQSWYDTNRTMDHDHNHIHTREQLKAYDPGLAAMCKDVLGETEWRFVSPRKRAGKGHLADLDYATAPKVVDPPHIENAAYDYYDKYWKDYWQRLYDKHNMTVAGKPKQVEVCSFKTTPSSDKNFECVDVKGWTFHIHKDYLYGDQDVLKNAIKNAKIQLGNVEQVIPPKPLAKLKKIPVWLNPGKRTAEYHWARSWLIDNGRNPDMVHAVQISDIEVLKTTRPSGPWVLLHELMHGYHDRVVSKEDNQAIIDSYKSALRKGMYQRVLHRKNRKDRYVVAYGGTRMEEYFSETCEAYFGTNDFYPFVKPELREYDPEMYEIIERVFEIKDEKK